MSTTPTDGSDGSTATTTDQQFTWDQLTIRATGPVERIHNVDEGWTMRADVDLDLERPIRDREEFVAVVLPASWISGRGDVVNYLLEGIDGHRLPTHDAREDWTVTVHGDVSDWLELARAAEDDRLGYPLANTSGLALLKNVAKEGVADPNALLALVQWADRRGADSTRDEWLATYQDRVSEDETDS